MHGRPRQRAGGPPPDKKEQAEVAELQGLLPSVLENNRTCCYTMEAMAQNARLLELNPELYTAWNYRKRAVKHLLGLESDEEACKGIAQRELDLVVRALRANPKSYGAWYHRKWVIRLGLSSLDAEFVLLKKLLTLDARNFHGWNYRRFAVRTKQVPADAELEFTTEKINENFSNYSAWHNRSALLSELSKNVMRKDTAQERLEEEYELVRNSFFTDPDDQSGWFYYYWLLSQTVAPVGPQVTGVWPYADDLASPYPVVAEAGGRGSIPLVISFSEPVTGVNKQTVSLSSSTGFSSEVSSHSRAAHHSPQNWKPVVPLPEYCSTWTSVYCLDDDEIIVLKRSSWLEVELVVGELPGIVSQDARAVEGPWKSRFRVFDGASRSKSGLRASIYHEADLEARKGQHEDVWHLRVLKREIELCRELLELEPDSKWAKLTLARLLLALDTYGTSRSESHLKSIRMLFKELELLDPTHAQYYHHQQSLLLLKEVMEDKGMKHKKTGELNLQDLSLSVIGCTERFLGVQVLDLGNNHLRSAHGLESLQLLRKLDLSHNRIGSVTGLAPLSALPMLEDLDVSYNRIGLHSVDTTRVLFPSILTGSCPPLPSKEVQESEKNLRKPGDLWEVKAVLEGMPVLRRFNLSGNPVAVCTEFMNTLKEVSRIQQVIQTSSSTITS